MQKRGLTQNLTFRLGMLTIATAAVTVTAVRQEWTFMALAALFCIHSLAGIRKMFRRNAEKLTTMFDAIDNADYAFKFATEGHSSHDSMINQSLNRITQIFLQARASAIQKEKYYELIMNSITTGILVIDDRGYVFQTNSEALRMLGLTVFSHVRQLGRVDETLEKLITHIRPGDKHQISFSNERETVTLSIHVSGMTLHKKPVRIIAINDIRSELDEKEIDSWIRLTRVLTHEIMNSITPITSLSETLLAIPGHVDEEIRNGLDVIHSTGKTLISFVDSYRKFTHIPMPKPSLFYVRRFAERMVQLTMHQNPYSNISIAVHVAPDDLILHADENLISLVVLNLLKNAVQAIGHEQTDGRIELKACCNEAESVIIEVGNNGPAIPPEEAKHIFVPFFTTKEGGSGIGLSVARQIMRLSGGSITLKNTQQGRMTSFVLTFP